MISDATVSPTFCACCRLADMNCLQDLTKTPAQAIRVFDTSLALLPLQCELLGF